MDIKRVQDVTSAINLSIFSRTVMNEKRNYWVLLERRGPGNYQSKRTKHKINSMNTRGQSDDTGRDGVRLVVQYALSADVVNRQTGL